MLCLTPPLFLPRGQNKIQQKFYCHRQEHFCPGCINLYRRCHQIIQTVEEYILSISTPLLKIRGQKKLH